MCNEDNRFGHYMVKAFNLALNDIEEEMKKSSSNVIKSSALVTIGKDKFYSNGLNLSEFFGIDSTSTSSKQEAIVKLIEFLDLEFLPLLGRLLIFPIPTIALINGHCYAGGLLLALSHDYRVGQAGNGFYCMNEIKIGLPIHPSMMALLQAKIDKQHITRDALLTAKRWSAEEALRDDIIDTIVPSESLLSDGKQFAKNIANNQYGGPNYSSLKESMYSNAYLQLQSQGKGARSKFTVKL